MVGLAKFSVFRWRAIDDLGQGYENYATRTAPVRWVPASGMRATAKGMLDLVNRYANIIIQQ